MDIQLIILIVFVIWCLYKIITENKYTLNTVLYFIPLVVLIVYVYTMTQEYLTHEEVKMINWIQDSITFISIISWIVFILNYIHTRQLKLPLSRYQILLGHILDFTIIVVLMIVIPILSYLFLVHGNTNLWASQLNVVMLILISVITGIFVAIGICIFISQFTLKKIRFLKLKKSHYFILLTASTLIAFGFGFIVVFPNLEQFNENRFDLTYILVAYGFLIVGISAIMLIVSLLGGSFQKHKLKDVHVFKDGGKSYFLIKNTKGDNCYHVAEYKEESYEIRNKRYTAFKYTNGTFEIMNLEGKKLIAKEDALLIEE